MRTMVRAILALALPLVGAAQASKYHPASDPAAVAIHERHVKASGGDRPPAYQHSIMESQIAGGPMMRLESYLGPENRILVRNYMGSELIMELGYDGETGWTSSPTTGVVRLDGKQLESMRGAISTVATPTVDSTTKATLLPRRTFEDQLVDAVLLASADGDSVETYYSVESGLLVGALNRMPPGPGPGAHPGAPPQISTMLFRDYKLVDGRQVSMTMVMRMGGMEIVAKTVHLSHEPIPPERFRPPPSAIGRR